MGCILLQITSLIFAAMCLLICLPDGVVGLSYTFVKESTTWDLKLHHINCWINLFYKLSFIPKFYFSIIVCLFGLSLTYFAFLFFLYTNVQVVWDITPSNSLVKIVPLALIIMRIIFTWKPSCTFQHHSLLPVFHLPNQRVWIYLSFVPSLHHILKTNCSSPKHLQMGSFVMRNLLFNVFVCAEWDVVVPSHTQETIFNALITGDTMGCPLILSSHAILFLGYATYTAFGPLLYYPTSLLDLLELVHLFCVLHL